MTEIGLTFILSVDVDNTMFALFFGATNNLVWAKNNSPTQFRFMLIGLQDEHTKHTWQ